MIENLLNNVVDSVFYVSPSGDSVDSYDITSAPYVPHVPTVTPMWLNHTCSRPSLQTPNSASITLSQLKFCLKVRAWDEKADSRALS